MIFHSIAVVVLLLVVAGGMALAWPLRKKARVGFGADVKGPDSAIDGGDYHHHSGGDGLSAHD